jgi:hypothetical protein
MVIFSGTHLSYYIPNLEKTKEWEKNVWGRLKNRTFPIGFHDATETLRQSGRSRTDPENST